MTAHARLSPSAASRWIPCPGSIALSETVPEQPSSKEAAEGTAFHQWAGECLELGLEPADFLGQTLTVDGHEFTFDDDMARFMQPGLDRIRELADGPMFIEQRVGLDPYLPGQFGTLDCGIFGLSETVIWDWKYGAGVPVSPVENPQLMLYALGFFYTPVLRTASADTRVRLVIEQPRAPGGGGEWTTTLDHLLAFGEKVKAVAAVIDSGNAPRVAGETQCKFCPARKVCPEFAAFNLDLFSMKFDDLDAEDEPVMPVLTPERRSYVVRHASMFTKWLEDLHADTLTDALAGRPTPGLKAVPGRKGARAWADQAAAEKFLKRQLGAKDAFNHTLKSPAQAEKVVAKDKWAKAQKLITQGDPKPVLVPEDDKREAIPPASSKFDDLTTTEDDNG